MKIVKNITLILCFLSLTVMTERPRVLSEKYSPVPIEKCLIIESICHLENSIGDSMCSGLYGSYVCEPIDTP